MLTRGERPQITTFWGWIHGDALSELGGMLAEGAQVITNENCFQKQNTDSDMSDTIDLIVNIATRCFHHDLIALAFTYKRAGNR